MGTDVSCAVIDLTVPAIGLVMHDATRGRPFRRLLRPFPVLASARRNLRQARGPARLTNPRKLWTLYGRTGYFGASPGIYL